MFRRNFGILALAADTGATGGAAVAQAPAAAPMAPTGAGAPPAETVTPANPATPAATPTRPRRGRGAAGNNVFTTDTLEAAQALAKEKGGRFTAFTVKSPAPIGKPDRYYVSNHRNAVQHAVATADGYHFASGGGGAGGRSLSGEKAQKRADELLAGMDETTRAALFAKYIGSAPAVAAALPPAAGPRNDTSAEFAATLTRPSPPTTAPTPAATPATSAPAAPAAAPTAPRAGNGNTGGRAPAGVSRKR